MPLDTSQYGQHVAQTLLSGLQVGQRFAQMRQEAAVTSRAQQIQSRRLRLEESQFQQELNPDSLVNKYRQVQVDLANARISAINTELDVASQNAALQQTLSTVKRSYPVIGQAEMAAATRARANRKPYTFGDAFAQFEANNDVVLQDKNYIAYKESIRQSINEAAALDDSYRRSMDDWSRATDNIGAMRKSAMDAFEMGDRLKSVELHRRADQLTTWRDSGMGDQGVPHAGTVMEAGDLVGTSTGTSVQFRVAEDVRLRNDLLSKFPSTQFGSKAATATVLALTMAQNPDLPLHLLSFVGEIDPARASDVEYLREFAASTVGEAAPIAGGAAQQPRRWTPPAY